MQEPQELTERQAAILEFIRKTMADTSRPPSSREICRRFGFKSPRAATIHLKRFVRTERGYRLEPANPDFSPIVVEDSASDFRLAGPVAGLVRRMEFAAARVA